MRVTLRGITQETHDTSTLLFEGEEEIQFSPGQFVMLEVQLRNEENFVVRDDKSTTQKRAFSIASAPKGTSFELCIKREPDGFVSDFLTTVVKEGEVFEFTGPYGKFCFDDSMKDIVLIAAGSGIAPMRSIIKHVLATKLDTTVNLFYSNKTTEDIAYEDELKELGTLDNVNVHFTITRPQLNKREWKGTIGRINYDMIQPTLTDLSSKYFFICGPPGLVKDIRQQLLDNGISDDHVKIEAWG